MKGNVGYIYHMECWMELDTKVRLPLGVQSITGGNTTPAKKVKNQIPITTETSSTKPLALLPLYFIQEA